MTLQGQQVHSHPSMPPHIVHTERSGANPPSVFPIVFPYTLVFPSKHVSVKAGKGNLLFYSFSNLSVISPMPQLILQPFRRFTYVTSHSPTLPLLHLRHSSFSNPSFASPTSQALHLIHLSCAHPFHHFTYVTAHSPTLLSLHRRHSSFSNPSFASLTSQALHLRHVASRP